MILILIVIIIVPMAIFLYPKNAGSTCGFCPGAPSIVRTEYGCMGVKYDYYPTGCMDCGTSILCSGIVTSEKKCYTYANKVKVEVPNCENPKTWQEVLDISPDFYIEAATFAYSAGEIEQAKTICKSRAVSEEKVNCLSRLYMSAMAKGNDSENAKEFCYALSDYNQTCLNELSRIIARSDIETSVDICKDIKDAISMNKCYYNAAMQAVNTNKTRALEICGMIDDAKKFNPTCEEYIESPSTYPDMQDRGFIY